MVIGRSYTFISIDQRITFIGGDVNNINACHCFYGSLKHYKKTSEGRAYKISDFLSLKQFRGLDLYVETRMAAAGVNKNHSERE